jgi:predicted nucleotidyltransferase
MEAVAEFGRRLSSLGGVTALLVGGSLATGDYVPGVSDLDLVALTDGPADQGALTELHRDLDAGVARGLDLGCVYVPVAAVPDRAAEHPTWTPGRLVRRILSGVNRAELVRHGYAVFGRPPAETFPPMTDDDVRAAARDELTGYWAWAARRPWMFRSPIMVDLGLTGMARGRYALAEGDLLTKSEAVQRAAAPPWLIAQLAARRRGEPVVSPRWRAGWIAWRDCRRTTAAAR